MNPTQDIRAMLVDFGQPVTLTGGAVVQAIPTLASIQDALGGDNVISGRTRTLKFVTADVPTLNEGNTVTWSGSLWRINAIRYFAEGYGLQAFLGAP
jgi:hypothetical protein